MTISNGNAVRTLIVDDLIDLNVPIKFQLSFQRIWLWFLIYIDNKIMLKLMLVTVTSDKYLLKH